jgi:nucleoside-diphosphate kinase
MSNNERTFIALKPDAVQRGLIGEILQRFERKGFKFVALKLVTPSRQLAESHYAEHSARPFFAGLVDFLTSGPVVAIVFEGKGVVASGRLLIGQTNPLTSAPGTIRGDYGIDVGRNLVHGSDSVESAQREIALWFSEEEQNTWQPTISSWVYEKL